MIGNPKNNTCTQVNSLLVQRFSSSTRPSQLLRKSAPEDSSICRYPASESDDLALDIEDHFGYHVDYTDIITTFDAKHDGKHEVFVKVDKRKKKKAMNFFFKYELLDNEDGPFEKIEQMEFRKYRRCREAIHGPK
ncbi:hypothetical protein Q1695_016369 [Nippostrongylus brasiliensis]|nr:hypothetical protein Q1695_016369 [Nippostrongylus brasiliensis]